MKYLIMDDGMKYQVVREDNIYYHCIDNSFRKSNPHIVDIIIEQTKKSSKKKEEVKEEIKEEE